MMVVRWSRENGRTIAMSGGPRLDAGGEDILAADLEGDARQGASRRTCGWFAGRRLKNP